MEIRTEPFLQSMTYNSVHNIFFIKFACMRVHTLIIIISCVNGFLNIYYINIYMHTYIFSNITLINHKYDYVFGESHHMTFDLS